MPPNHPLAIPWNPANHEITDLTKITKMEVEGVRDEPPSKPNQNRLGISTSFTEPPTPAPLHSVVIVVIAVILVNNTTLHSNTAYNSIKFLCHIAAPHIT